MSDSEGDCNSPIPSVNERLGQLRPSRELLEYYRKKVADFDNEHDEMVAKLDAYKVNYEDQHRMECELTQREQEISDLQKAISDLQVCVLQEREQVLRLYAENDRLKIREVGDRKRIQHLLALAGPAAAEVSYFHKDPPSKIVIPQKLPKSQLPNEDQSSHKKKPLSEIQNKPGKSPKPTVTSSTDNQSLALQVEALQAQLEEQTKLARDQVSALLEERRIMQEESDLARERDRDRYERYAKRLREAQNLLHESTQDVLTLKRSHRGEEKEWMAEKDKLLQEMDLLRDQLDAVNLSNHGGKPTSAATLANVCASEFEARAQLEAEVTALEQQLDQAGKLADMYREQCIQTEDELSRMREEAEVHRDIFKERSDKIAKRLKLMTIRYAALEKRRSSEVEGFKTDVKNLRKRLKEVEKQLYKVTVGDAVSDAHVLQTVHATAGRSRAIQNELKTLKDNLDNSFVTTGLEQLPLSVLPKDTYAHNGNIPTHEDIYNVKTCPLQRKLNTCPLLRLQMTSLYKKSPKSKMLSRSVARNLRKMSNFPQKSLKVEHDVANKEFFVKIPGCNERAYLSYQEIEKGSVDLEHTVVPESFRGRGIGQILAKTALDDMVAKGMKMKLTCWYLQKYVKENPSDDYKHLVI